MTDHNPFYDGRTVYTLRLDRLRPGDVILTRNRRDPLKIGRVKSSTIAIAGGSNFSHAAICAQLPTLIEAISPGVSTLSLANTFYHDERDVRVLRYGDETVARRAAAKAAFFLGKGYSVPMAIRSVMPSASDLAAPMLKTFCSALVAAAYRAADAPEFQTVNPYRTTPGDLKRMPWLNNITADVASGMLAPRNVEDMTALDGVRQASPFDGQAKALAALYAAVAEDIEAFIQQSGARVAMPTSFFEVLGVLTGALVQASASDDPGMRSHLTALQAIDQKLADAFDSSDLPNMNAIAEAKDSETLARDIRESFEPKPDIDIAAVRAILGVTAGQIASRSWVLEDQHRHPGLSQAWDRWCDLSACAVATLRLREAALREILDRVDQLPCSQS